MASYHAVVWLDRKEAHIITFEQGIVELQRIKSRSHHLAPGGHAGAHQNMHGRASAHGHHSPAGGHATVDQDYYHKIAQALAEIKEILVTGPAQAKVEFRAHCERHDPIIAKAIIGVVPSDHPSDEQLVVMAREHFIKYDHMHSQR